MTSFVVSSNNLDDRNQFIICCDNHALNWLTNSFRSIGDGVGFVVGDGNQILSDGKCVISVLPQTNDADVQMRIIDNRHFQWYLPSKLAIQYADLIEAMTNFNGPCHQYLEVADSCIPVVIVSKGEYDVDSDCSPGWRARGIRRWRRSRR